jgi:fused signal recognition particle receptor
MFKFFQKLPAKIAKPGKRLFQSLRSLFKFEKIDGDALDEIERALLAADFGTKTTQEIIGEIKLAHKKEPSMRKQNALEIAAAVIRRSLSCAEAELPTVTGKPLVVCLIGVNGAGKTTTAAKLAQFFRANGKSVLLAGCDTFRAAAGEQIKTLANKLALDIVSGQSGGDAAAVAYDAYQSALARKYDVLIADTAGRLHVKANLMAELQKISKILKKLDGDVQLHNWLVVDGSLGTNSLESAKIFHGEVGLGGLIVTKMDGSSRGGAIVGIHRELQIPILFLGTGERMEDFSRFSVNGYVDALFGAE